MNPIWVVYYVCACKVFSHVWLFMTLWIVAYQAPLSMGILQAGVLEWVAIPLFRGSSQCKGQTWIYCVSCTVGRSFTTEPPGKPMLFIYEYYTQYYFKY